MAKFKYINLKDIIATWLICALIIAGLICTFMFLASADRERTGREVIRYLRLEEALSAGQQLGFKNLIVIEDPLSDKEVQQLIDTRPVCIVVENNIGAETVVERFFNGDSKVVKYFRTDSGITQNTVDGLSDIILNRAAADNLYAANNKTILNGFYVTVWYDLKSPVNFMYLGTIGIDRQTAQYVTLTMTISKRKEAERKLGIGDSKEAAVEYVYKTIAVGTEDTLLIHRQGQF